MLCPLFQEMAMHRIDSSICPGVSLLVSHENLTLAISLPSINISLSNFEIILMMTVGQDDAKLCK